MGGKESERRLRRSFVWAPSLGNFTLSLSLSPLTLAAFINPLSFLPNLRTIALPDIGNCGLAAALAATGRPWATPAAPIWRKSALQCWTQPGSQSLRGRFPALSGRVQSSWNPRAASPCLPHLRNGRGSFRCCCCCCCCCCCLSREIKSRGVGP